MYSSILVPIDGSEHSLRALEVAHALVTPEEATIYLLAVPELPPAKDTIGDVTHIPASGLSRADVESAARRLLDELVAAEQAGHSIIERIKERVGLTRVETESIVRMGVPAEVIVDEAERLGVQAIVMGSRGLSDIRGLVVGSVSHKVMHTAKCRVIMVH